MPPVRYFVAGFLAGTLIIALTEMEELWENLTMFKEQQPEGNSNQGSQQGSFFDEGSERNIRTQLPILDVADLEDAPCFIIAFYEALGWKPDSQELVRSST